MNIISSVQQLFKFPPQTILKKIISRLTRQYNYRYKQKTLKFDDRRAKLESLSVTSLLNDSDTKTNTDLGGTLYVHNLFDLLGSSWAYNRYDSTKETVLDSDKEHANHLITNNRFTISFSYLVVHNHVYFSRKCWSSIINLNPSYTPIDWQLDFKSGFRWDARIWFRGQRKLSDGKLGVDIKVPWELSRLQHIPTLLMREYKDDAAASEAVRHATCQLLDFVMGNPIGMGVNFNCPMDIGIRSANMLIAVDLIKSLPHDNIWTHEIEQIILNFVAHSTTHILSDIEYRDGLTSNHYLGNVLGILFAGFYINNHEDSDRWLAFGLQELERSMERQFFDDGANFEGSTSYHRLSGEMMIWGAFIALSVSEDRKQRLKSYKHKPWKHEAPLFAPHKQQFNAEPYLLSKRFWTKLLQGGIFTTTIAKANGEIPQFGDNDSGRFISITPVGEWLPKQDYIAKYKQITEEQAKNYPDQVWDENHLNHAGYVSAVMGLFGKPVENKHLYAEVEYNMFQDLAKRVPGFEAFTKTLQISDYRHKQKESFAHLDYHKKKTFDYTSDLLSNLEAYYCPDFQIAVLKGDNLYLAIGGTSNHKQHHSWGHTHNDKLSFELQVNGEDIFVNPGTYLYTPNPEMRYLFRSVKSHNTISVDGQEQNRPLPGAYGLFNMKRETTFKLLELSDTSFVGELRYRDIVHIRRIEVTNNSVILEDWCNYDFEQHFNDKTKLYSNGYGKLIAG